MPSKEIIHIRAGAFEGFSSLLWEKGVDPSLVLQKIGLDEACLETPDFLIPTDMYRHALNHAAQLCREPHFGLLMSQKQTLHKFGAIGYLMMHANTVGQSIACLDQYLRIHDTGSTARMDIRKGTVLWMVGLRALCGVSALQHTELAIGIAVKVIRTISSEKWSPTAVYFEHSKPKNVKIHERIFRCPVFFEQAANGLEFPADFLETKLPSADMGLYKIIQSHIEGIAEEKGDDFVGLVKQSIEENLERGKPCIQATAQEFGMGTAQFQRKLKQEGANFQDALQDVRYGLACKYLSDTDMSVATISTLLAYAEPAVFSRAFRRNAGVTPRDWRRQNIP
jgi:AraC-like DNA-binding protein